MKKRFFVMMLALVACMASFAQESDSRAKGENYYYAPYNYVQLQAGAGYTIGEAPFADQLSLPTAAVSFGRQFNDFFGMRLSASGWEGKGGWGNELSKANRADEAITYKYNYVAGNLDFMFNIFNLFERAERPFELFAFIGGGVNYAFNNDEANAISNQYPHLAMEYLWNGSKVSPIGRAGLMANINLNEKWAINLEGNYSFLTDKYNSKNGGNLDKYVNAFVGVTYKFGKKAIPAPVVIPEPEPEPVVEVVKPEPKPVVVVPEDIRRDVFFKIRAHDLSAESIAKLNEVVAYMEKYPEAKVSVSAYADVQTGNPRINKKYSEERRQAVVDYLTSKGVAAGRITSESFGDTVQPFAENDDNRAAICIATVK